MQAPSSTVPGTSDRECLESWVRHRDGDSLQTLVERYLVFVHASVLRRTGDAAQAAEVTRAVFLVLARRAQIAEEHRVAAEPPGSWAYANLGGCDSSMARVLRIQMAMPLT